MAKPNPKFPALLHIRWHPADGNESEWREVLDGGVFDEDEHGAPVAIYKLVDVGTVEIAKRFKSRGHR